MDAGQTNVGRSRRHAYPPPLPSPSRTGKGCPIFVAVRNEHWRTVAVAGAKAFGRGRRPSLRRASGGEGYRSRSANFSAADGSLFKLALKKSSVSGRATCTFVSRCSFSDKSLPRHCNRWPPWRRSSEMKCRW